MLSLLKKTFRKSNFSIAFTVIFMAFSLFSAIYFLSLGQVKETVLSLVCVVFIFPSFYLFQKLLSFDIGGGFTFLLLFLVAGGLILGPSYNLYMTIPFFDDALHCVSGLVFAATGYLFAERLLKNKISDRFLYCFLFAIFFSLATAVVWEMIEYIGTTFFHLDMQEDKIVTSFHSYLLAGTHAKVVDVDNIVKTIIYYGDNQTLVIDGYLDLGLFDTLNDLVCCIVGTASFAAFLLLDKVAGRALSKAFVKTEA